MAQKCPSCYGTGLDPLKSGFVKHECKTCGGTGTMSEQGPRGDAGSRQPSFNR